VKQTWSQPTLKGSPPTPRDSHTCTAIGDNLFVFGGTDGMNPLKDLHILDTCESSFSYLNYSPFFASKSHNVCSLAQVESMVYVQAGTDVVPDL